MLIPINYFALPISIPVDFLNKSDLLRQSGQYSRQIDRQTCHDYVAWATGQCQFEGTKRESGGVFTISPEFLRVAPLD